MHRSPRDRPPARPSTRDGASIASSARARPARVIVRHALGAISLGVLAAACVRAAPTPVLESPPADSTTGASAARPLPPSGDTARGKTREVAESASSGPLSPADSAEAALAGRRLLVPVAGIDAARILDSFFAPRGARSHNALDIMAPRGTPVVSADDGMVLRVSENRAGGLTVYTTDPERRLVYYYAHMDRYADGIAAGRPIARGDTLGFVGTTGNAPRDIPHLHFQMMLMHPEGRYWAGTPVNPLPFLLAASTEINEPDE
jgi:murein DD-endopeptidase MepM/ murein hydrolase activator NlpD